MASPTIRKELRLCGARDAVSIQPQANSGAFPQSSSTGLRANRHRETKSCAQTATIPTTRASDASTIGSSDREGRMQFSIERLANIVHDLFYVNKKCRRAATRVPPLCHL